MDEEVILVDENDYRIGLMPKLEAHQKGVLHRAFSVFIFNDRGELLLQQRAADKYHSGGLWTNTCCSHPRNNEDIHSAALRRLREEMGLSCEIRFIFSFIYHADLDQGLIEHEFDHVFIGVTNQIPVINQSEVQQWKYQNLQSLTSDVELHPMYYTAWMKKCLGRVVTEFEKIKK